MKTNRNKRNNKKLLWVATLMLTAVLNVQAQVTVLQGDHKIQGSNGSTTTIPSFEVQGTGGVLFGGQFGQGSIPVQTGGVHMIWYPKKAAFAVGSMSNMTDNNFGDYSFTAGSNNLASGEGAVALGEGNIATGQGAVALGISNSAVDGAFGMGAYNFANGSYSMAVGLYSQALCRYSIALGEQVCSYADGAFASGRETMALGEYSFVNGVQTSSDGLGQFVIGISNVPWVGGGHYNPEGVVYVQPAGNDAVFIIGNGSTDYFSDEDFSWHSRTQSNALVVRYDAEMRSGGKIQAKNGFRTPPGGDISMGGFTAGNNPATMDNGLKYSGE